MWNSINLMLLLSASALSEAPETYDEVGFCDEFVIARGGFESVKITSATNLL